MSAPIPRQVDRVVLREMYAVDGDERADRLRPRGQLGGRWHRADGVGGEREGDELRAIGQLRVERVEVQRDVVRTNVDPSDGGAGIARGEQPRPDVRVVVEPGHDDLVARSPRPSERARQVQQQRRRVLAEDHLARVAAEEVGARPARVGDQRVDLLARREHAVGVRRAGAHRDRSSRRSPCPPVVSRRGRPPTRRADHRARDARERGSVCERRWGRGRRCRSSGEVPIHGGRRPRKRKRRPPNGERLSMNERCQAWAASSCVPS